MNKRQNTHINNGQEFNLKLLFEQLYRNKLLFLISIVGSLAMAIIYIKLATPIYEVSTSILIDPSGDNRALGTSKYVEGGVGLIETEKNLYNEIGIIKSFSLISQTVKDLDLDISYHAGNWLKTREYYGYFPFEVNLMKNEAQLYGVPFEIRILSNEKYRLSIDGKNFAVRTSTGSTYEVDRDFKFSYEYKFGDKVQNDYFNFIIKRPSYKVNFNDFKDRNLSFTVNNPEAVASSYLSKIEVNNIDIQASIFKIVSFGAVASKEIAFLKKHTENYVQNKLKSRNKIASGKEIFIREQLGIIADSLLKVELDLESFKKTKRAVNLSATANNALNLTQNLQIDKAKIELDIKYYKSLITFVEENLNDEDFMIPTAIGVNNPLINENIRELTRLYTEKSEKKFYLTSNNQEITMLNEQIQESTQALLANLRSAIQSSEFRLQGLMSQLSNYNGVISGLPTSEKQLLGIERQSTLYENLFNYLSQELAKTGIARAESNSDTRVLDEARLIGPVSPKKMLVLALAIALGLIIPAGWIALFSPNDIIYDLDQIMSNSDIPVITSITYHNPESKRANSLSSWNLKESFRDLSANLKLISPRIGCTILGITSIMPEEGKTFCTINLGITLAEAGKKTLIIDTDLRNPSLVDGIKKIKGKGLSDYLQGDIHNFRDIIYQHDQLKNLQFIPTSVAEDNFHELLSGIKIKSLISNLKESYDYIILDTPAAGLVSDFLLFRDEIDINLFVIRRKVAKIAFLEDLERLAPRGKKKKNYIIFNDALQKNHKYGYGQQYGINKEKQLINQSLSV